MHLPNLVQIIGLSALFGVVIGDRIFHSWLTDPQALLAF